MLQHNVLLKEINDNIGKKRISRLLTTRGMEQITTTKEVAMSKMTIWISAPAMRRKLLRRRKSDRRLVAWSVPREVRRINCLCMRIRAMHTKMLETTVTIMRKELKPAYMYEKAAWLDMFVFQSMKHQVSGYWSVVFPKPMFGMAQKRTLET